MDTSMVCTLVPADKPDVGDACPGCIASAGLREDLGRIAAAFERADRRAKAAATVGDREAAEAERREAVGEFWVAGVTVADLLLLLLRLAMRHRPEALAAYLAEALRQ